jgi:hypothetical protein
MSQQPRNLPSIIPHNTNNNNVVTTRQQEDDSKDVIVGDEKIQLTANEEKRLKQAEYNRQQASHTKDVNIKANNRAHNHGRDHGESQIQSRTQNH